MMSLPDPPLTVDRSRRYWTPRTVVEDDLNVVSTLIAIYYNGDIECPGLGAES